MKKIKLLFAVSFLLFQFANAQKSGNWCGTKDDVIDKEWIQKFRQENPDWMNFSSSRSSQLFYVPIKFHIVCNDAGTNCSYKIKDVLDILCRLNSQFIDSVGFHFYIYQDIEFIKASVFMNQMAPPGTSSEDDLFGNFNVPNVYNVYIVDQSDKYGGVTYSSPRGGGVILPRDQNPPSGIPTNTTFAHESGHYFSLPHTFTGWGQASSNFTCSVRNNCEVIPSNCSCNPYLNDSTGCYPSNVEYVSRTIDSLPANSRLDCYERGDGFCDTEADYFNGGWCGSACSQWKDPSGVKIKPNSDFHMSYAWCTTRFSDEQEIQMQEYMKSPERNFLWINTPDAAEFTDVSLLTTTAISPINNQVVPADWVELKWDAVPGATRYHLTVDRQSGTTTPQRVDRIITETSYRIPMSSFKITTGTGQANDSGKFFIWKVKPLTILHTCGSNYTPNSVFQLGKATGINSISTANSISIYPNPVNNNQFHLSLETDGSYDAKYQILNINGQLIKSEKLSFTTGTNDKLITLPEGISKGIYLFKLTSAGENYLQKIVVM